ncbi:MAG: hypothetical protein U9N60_09560 [Thermodesulfobacteriota bacterium]|nr:hypothetical protein [Thermodesulfobacteriota bacterium]
MQPEIKGKSDISRPYPVRDPGHVKSDVGSGYYIKSGCKNLTSSTKVTIEQAKLNDKKLEFKIVDDGFLIQPLKKASVRMEKTV